TDDIYSRTVAILYIYNDQYHEAKKLLRKLLEINMNSAELHYLLGVAEKNDGKSDLARMEFEKALIINPKYKDAWMEYCVLLSREKKYDEAIRAAEKFIKELPEEASAYRMKGYVLSIIKDYKGAIASLKKAVSIDSTDSYAWFELGSAFERSNDFSHAEKAFKKALSIDPDNPLTLNYLGYMWAEKGKNLDSAKILIEKALKRDPLNGAIIDSYGWVFYQLGKYDSALVYLTKASQRISDDPIIFSHLGDALVKLKNYKEAISAYHRAIELNSEEKEKIRKKILELEIFISNQEY
ncbi:MAG: tetratricopeptide repeat protein, partial [Chitinispirillaceae bacterium]|nr:tetratricopeptide repeat protein [Chitinispirillaceae bacterium]